MRRTEAAGLWRDTPEWGPAYTMVMTEACQHVADVHDRMPVILRRDDWSDWLDGAPDKAGLLCRPYPEMVVCERTGESWNKRQGPSARRFEGMDPGQQMLSLKITRSKFGGRLNTCQS